MIAPVTRAPRGEILASDRALLRAIEATGSLVRACTQRGMSRDRGVYRLRRLAQIAGRPVVTAHRGGRTPGGTQLTATGRALAREPGGASRAAAMNRFVGTVLSERPPVISVAPGLSLTVGFPVRAGERVALAFSGESVLLARTRVATSARNVLSGTVDRIAPLDARRTVLALRVGGRAVWAMVTPESVRQLGLAPGRRLFAYLKATAIVRAGAVTRGSRRA
jgi:molybdate transport system regulatory protein